MCGWWANGPNMELPPGYGSQFAHHVARRDGHGAGTSGIDKDVRLFCSLTDAIFDASIAGWGVKREVDYVRRLRSVIGLFIYVESGAITDPRAGRGRTRCTRA